MPLPLYVCTKGFIAPSFQFCMFLRSKSTLLYGLLSPGALSPENSGALNLKNEFVLLYDDRPLKENQNSDRHNFTRVVEEKNKRFKWGNLWGRFTLTDEEGGLIFSSARIFSCCTVGWVDIGTRTKVPLKFVAYLSKTTKINEKSVLTQWPLHRWSQRFGSCTI
jgi:hypothetical protein